MGGLHVQVVYVHVYSLPRRRYHIPHTLCPRRGSLGVARGLDLSLRLSLLSNLITFKSLLCYHLREYHGAPAPVAQL